MFHNIFIKALENKGPIRSGMIYEAFYADKAPFMMVCVRDFKRVLMAKVDKNSFKYEKYTLKTISKEMVYKFLTGEKFYVEFFVSDESIDYSQYEIEYRKMDFYKLLDAIGDEILAEQSDTILLIHNLYKRILRASLSNNTDLDLENDTETTYFVKKLMMLLGGVGIMCMENKGPEFKIKTQEVKEQLEDLLECFKDEYSNKDLSVLQSQFQFSPDPEAGNPPAVPWFPSGFLLRLGTIFAYHFCYNFH